jgi:ABC-type bacteriocin/lantibiotic exporter with double-glycine peptidase domain
MVKDIEKRQFSSGRLLALSDSLKEPLIIIMLVSVILFMYYVKGLDISSVIISVALLYRASTSLSRCQGQWQKAMEWFGSFANIDNEFLFLETASHNVERQEVSEVTSFKLENVGYAYDGMPQEIFSNVSCIIEKPSLTVVRGSSGSGKSTLMDLLCGLRAPTSGTVTAVFDNSSLDSSQANIKVGYVGQNCLIFDGNIISNVSLKANNTTAEVKRICEILRSVGLERWANEDKSGIYRHVTNSGSVLSGGERQRLAIAREIYRRPHIFVFDEPTSSLDSVATLRINELIDRLAAEHIVVVISHKNDVFQQASNVLLISNPKNPGKG